MRRKRSVIGLAVGIAVALALATVVMLVAAAAGSSMSVDATTTGTLTGCDPTVATTATSAGASSNLASLTATQLQHAQQIIAAGNQAQVPPSGITVALAVAGTESRYLNLANPTVPVSLTIPNDGIGADHDSLGLFQQRPSMGWGTPAQLMDPTYAADAFYKRLLALTGWQQLPVTVAAQDVQRSEFPDAYAAWAALAGQLEAKYGDATDVSGCDASSGQDLTGVRATIVNAATAEIGLPYVWDAGDASGPTTGLAGCDTAAIGGCSAVGFDCSGLALYAWAKAGYKLNHYAADQYTEGIQVPIAQAQPGDLLFWATNPAVPSSIHHVAIYIGNGQMIEAPESGERVHQTAVRHDDELMPLAVEPPTK